METLNPNTISRLPASRFPNPRRCLFLRRLWQGRDEKTCITTGHPFGNRLARIWHACQCAVDNISAGAAEWDDLTTWERKQRIRQLRIGFVLFALLMIPGTLAYFALSLGSTNAISYSGNCSDSFNRGCKTARVRSARRVRNNRFNLEDKGQWEKRLRAKVDFSCVSPAQAPVKPGCSSHCRAHNRDSLDSIRPPSGVTRGCLAVATEIECYPAGDFVRTRRVATFAHGASCGNRKSKA